MYAILNFVYPMQFRKIILERLDHGRFQNCQAFF